MMKYKVLRSFINIDGSFLRINDYIECTEDRARLLRNNGMIGNRIELAVKDDNDIPEVNIDEKAIEKPFKRKYRKN